MKDFSIFIEPFRSKSHVIILALWLPYKFGIHLGCWNRKHFMGVRICHRFHTVLHSIFFKARNGLGNKFWIQCHVVLSPNPRKCYSSIKLTNSNPKSFSAERNQKFWINLKSEFFKEDLFFYIWKLEAIKNF